MWNNSEIKIVIYEQIIFYIASQLDACIAICVAKKHAVK